MHFPKLRPVGRRRYTVDCFLGYDCRPEAPAGSFRVMENLSGSRFPHLCVRGARRFGGYIEGVLTDRVLALGGGMHLVLLDASGTLWSGSECLPRVLEHSVSVSIEPLDDDTVVEDYDLQRVLALFPTDGERLFTYDRENERWVSEDRRILTGNSFRLDPLPQDGDRMRIRVTTALTRNVDRELVFMGGWVCVFPDGVYANAERLRAGHQMVRGEDYGVIGQKNVCRSGAILMQTCDERGSVLTVTDSRTAPESGYWVDSSQPDPVLRYRAAAGEDWAEVSPYVKCSIPGIAKYVSAGDGVELASAMRFEAPDWELAEEFFSGSHLLTAAYHDPGAVGREEGMQDYIVIPGLLARTIDFEIRDYQGCMFSLSRPLPEMDFVVSCQNRLWGCRFGDGVNELFGCKLGDFRNWAVFEGLSTDSYRVSRGENAPFTGAAVLDGSPIFFRENGIERIYPSAGGDHGVVTRTLPGIKRGSHRSAVVIREALYYHGRAGIYRFDGTLPVLVSRPLGTAEYQNAVAAALGERYYVSLKQLGAAPSLFVLDTLTGRWFREDDEGMVLACSYLDGIYYGTVRGGPLRYIGPPEDPAGVRWYAETGELAPLAGTRRYLSRLRLTGKVPAGSELRVYLSYDCGPWIHKGDFIGGEFHSETFPVWPRRADSVRLRLEGTGGMELSRISCLIEAGSDE